MSTPNTTLNEMQQLIDIMNELREKCPWDKKQTLESLSLLTIEEVYELTDAIRTQNTDEIKKELGDLLLHIVFYSKIASEKEYFTLADVIKNLNKKLIDRHPHIYDPNFEKAKTEDEVKKIWETNKIKKGATSVLQGIPKHLPALVKAYRLQEKTSGIGFDWDNSEDIYAKIVEEIEEFHQEKKVNNKEEMEAEFGDILFSLINYARFLKIDPEQALQKTNDKFSKRFQKMEQLINDNNLDISKLNLEQMDKFWDKAKQLEKQNK